MKRDSALQKEAAFRRRLLSWYDKKGRHDLPWRTDWDPYAILVSELMLQQTTVQTVIPYFHRFLKRFPTFKALATASQEEVLSLWSGLGYYARARNLQKAAQRLVAHHGGRLPRTRAAVEDLPGVGPYTAGALLSFAYDLPEALVDGNVVRVLSRVFGVKENTKDPKTLQKLWVLARRLVPPGGGRRFNSALMDLGATVCRPDGPDCPRCPFRALCWAQTHERQNEIPRRVRDKPKTTVHLHSALWRKGDRWWLRRRPTGGLYGGLWEFPGVEIQGDAAAVQGLRERWGMIPVGESPGPVFAHTLSHRQILMRPWWCQADDPPSEGDWFLSQEISTLAISSLTRKVWRWAQNEKPR